MYASSCCVADAIIVCMVRFSSESPLQALLGQLLRFECFRNIIDKFGNGLLNVLINGVNDDYRWLGLDW